jgi:hypothetical protein
MITQLSELKPSTRVIKGEQSPMQGWHSQAHVQLIPTTTLILKLEGQSAELTLNFFLEQERGVSKKKDRGLIWQYTTIHFISERGTLFEFK